MSRTTNIATVISGICCIAIAVLWPATNHLTLGDFGVSSNCLRLTATTRCGLSAGRIVFFSDKCPYNGSIMYISDGDLTLCEGGPAYMTRDYLRTVGRFGISRRSFRHFKTGELLGRDRAANLPGIYYREFDWKSYGAPYWTLRASLWYPILFFSIFPALWAFRRYCSRKKTIPQ